MGQQSSSSLSHSGNALNSVAAQSCYYDPIGGVGSGVSNSSPGGNSCALQHMNSGTTGASGAGAAALYPSMSVNVSMNMTMHGYGATDATMPMQCSQVSVQKWTERS